MGTDFPVIDLDRRLYMDPAKMRDRIVEVLENLPSDIITVLVSMGFCGGSWDRNGEYEMKSGYERTWELKAFHLKSAGCISGNIVSF